MDISKLSPEPWESVTCMPAGESHTDDGDYASWGESPWHLINGPPQHISDEMLCRRVFTNRTDTKFMALCRSDLGVKLRRGWHTEKCKDGDQWFIPNIQVEVVVHALDTKDEAGFDATYQDRHDVGLLTKAEAWYVANIESKAGWTRGAWRNRHDAG